MNSSTISVLVNVSLSTAFVDSIPHPSIAVIYNTFLTLSLVFGTLGNSLVLFVYSKGKVSTSTDWFVIFISIFDLLSSCVNVPVYLTFSTGTWQKIGNNFLCKLHMFVSQSVVLSSTFLVCGLAIDRYLKICTRNGNKINQIGATHICTMIALVTCLLSLPCFGIYNNADGRCVAVSMESGVFVYYMLLFFTYILAFVVIAFSYTRISMTVLKSESKVAKHMNSITNQPASTACYFRRNKNKVAPSVILFPANKQEETPTVITIERSDNQYPEKSSSNSHLTVPSRLTSARLSITSISTISTVSTLFSETSTIPPSMTLTNERSTSALPKTTRRHEGKGRRTTITTFAGCLIFILSWLPPWITFILLSIPDMRQNPHVLAFGQFGKVTYLINTFMNPILYLLMNRKFREQSYSIFCCSRKTRVGST